MEDPELDAVESILASKSELQTRVGNVVRAAIDDVLDTRRSGRVDIHSKTELTSVEKTFVGTRVELRLIEDLGAERGQVLDMVVGPAEVDVKFTLGKNWMIPREAVDGICLVISADDRRSLFTAGLVRCSRDNLGGPQDDAEVGQGDRKRSLNALGRSRIRDLVPRPSPLPENLLLHLDPELRAFVLGEAGQERKFLELFSRLPGKVITRHYVEAIGRSTDPQNRVRKIRGRLGERGFDLLCGTWDAERERAVKLGITIRAGDFVSVPSDGSLSPPPVSGDGQTLF